MPNSKVTSASYAIAQEVLNGQLLKLGLAPRSALRDGVPYRRLPDLTGWCQVVPVPEEAWPPGATLCVIVRWHPDRMFRRDHREGRVPVGASIHWRERRESIMETLRGLGYAAAITGPPRVPSLHAYEDILVWLQPGDSSWPPCSSWAGLEPATPHFGRQMSTGPEHRALRRVEGVLKQAANQWPAPYGTLTVQRPLAACWPPHAEVCVRVVWRPAEQYLRRPNGRGESEAERHWRCGIGRVRQALTAANYRVREPERARTPALDEYAGFVVWRPRRP